MASREVERRVLAKRHARRRRAAARETGCQCKEFTHIHKIVYNFIVDMPLWISSKLVGEEKHRLYALIYVNKIDGKDR